MGLTPVADGSAFNAILDFTRAGTQSDVAHAPRRAPPQIWPIRRQVAFSPLCARI